jgi:hypothetical protein
MADLVSTRRSLGFVQIVTGQSDDGREFMRLEWSVARHRRDVQRLPRAANENSGGCDKLCSGCVWFRPSGAPWSNRGMDGKQVIRSPKAWEYGKCRHPEAITGGDHLVSAAIEPEATYAKSMRASYGKCGLDGKFYAAAEQQVWRHPRVILPALAAAAPLLAVVWIAIAYSSFAPLGFFGVASGALGFGLWHLARMA